MHLLYHILLRITIHFKFLLDLLQSFIFVFKCDGIIYYLVQQQHEEKGRVYLRDLVVYSVATEYNSNHCRNILQFSDKLSNSHPAGGFNPYISQLLLNL